MLARLFFFILSAILFGCGATKQKPTTTSATPAPSNNMELPPPPPNTYAPGEAELLAVQSKYADATLVQLNEGYTIYTKGACTKCHEVENIYKFSETRWVKIINEMSIKAKLSADKKDVVLKYVMSVKATQPEIKK
jgi:hypothetical protein